MNNIEASAQSVLIDLAGNNIESIWNKDLAERSKLEPQILNDSISYLKDIGAISTDNFLGTHPYTFGIVNVLPRGRYIYNEIIDEQKRTRDENAMPKRQTNPVGSPYGFTEDDWEYVELKRRQANIIYIIFGYQFESRYYDTSRLIQNIKSKIESINAKINNTSTQKIEVVFKSLSAGYGEHLFNSIAREIISADIAIFETSDGNPNVMIELGVALTWGIKVLPIRNKVSMKPPSDISGQTWVEYTESGTEFCDPEFDVKLEVLMNRIIRKINL